MYAASTRKVSASCSIRGSVGDVDGLRVGAAVGLLVDGAGAVVDLDRLLENDSLGGDVAAVESAALARTSNVAFS